MAEWQTQQTQNLPTSNRAGSSPASGTIFFAQQDVRVPLLSRMRHYAGHIFQNGSVLYSFFPDFFVFLTKKTGKHNNIYNIEFLMIRGKA